MADILLDTFAGTGWLVDHTSDNGLAWAELDAGFVDRRLDLTGGVLRLNPGAAAARAAYAYNPASPSVSPILVPPFAWEAEVFLTTGGTGTNAVAVGLMLNSIIDRVTCGIRLLNTNTSVSIGTGDFDTAWNSVSAPSVVPGVNTVRVEVDALGFAYFYVNEVNIYAALDQTGGIGASYFPGVWVQGLATVNNVAFYAADPPLPDGPYTGGWWRKLANSTQEIP